MKRTALLLAVCLAACGGADQLQQQAPTPAAPAASAPAPAAPAWVQAWLEPWRHPTFAGIVQQPFIDCRGSPDDPGTAEVQAVDRGADWLYFPSQWQPDAGIVSADLGQLVLDSLQSQTAGGWAILTAQSFDRGQAWRVESTIDLQPDPGAWISLPLIAGEGSFRQLSVREASGLLAVDMGGPCAYQQLLGGLQPGPVALAVEWRPALGWAFVVNGATLYTEPAGYRNNIPAGPMRAGLYVVNVGVEAGARSTGLVRATVDQIKVSTWKDTP